MRKQELQKVVDYVKRKGHLYYAFGEAVSDFVEEEITREDHPALVRAVRSVQDFNAYVIEPLIDKHYPERRTSAVRIDGKWGPAMKELMRLPQCGEPDWGPELEETAEATGTGNWKGCHGIGDFHCVAVSIDNAPPSHLKPHFKEVLTRVRKAFAEKGLWILWVGPHTPFPEDRERATGVNINFSFVGGRTGWIGLAILGHNQRCGSTIWCKYQRSYTPSDIVRLWTILIMHELGHNCGRNHTRGGVMNSFILSLPPTWIGDTSDAWMNGQFGGEPVIIGDDDDDDDRMKLRLVGDLDLLSASAKITTFHIDEVVNDDGKNWRV